jgi:phospholipase/carboxylesterase
LNRSEAPPLISANAVAKEHPMHIYDFPTPTIDERTRPNAPLAVLLHGRGSDASEIIALASHLPPTLSYVAVRAPIAEGSGYAWFANRGIGRPLADSLAATMAWFDDWLSEYETGQPIHLIGYSGGAAFAGGFLLKAPHRFASVALLRGTLPWEAGLTTEPNQLVGAQTFLSHGQRDNVIPADLLRRTWQYLTVDSGATTTADRADTGHELDQSTLVKLSAWLSSRTTDEHAAKRDG